MQQVNQYKYRYQVNVFGHHEYSHDFSTSHSSESLEYTLSYIYSPDHSSCWVTLYEYIEQGKTSIYSQSAENKESFKDIHRGILAYLSRHYQAVAKIHDAMLEKFSSDRISKNLLAHTESVDDQSISKSYYSINESQETQTSPFLKMFYQKTPFFLEIEIMVEDGSKIYTLEDPKDFVGMQLMASMTSPETESILSPTFDDIYTLAIPHSSSKGFLNSKNDQIFGILSAEKKRPSASIENSDNFNAGSPGSSNSATVTTSASEPQTPASSPSQSPKMSQNFNSTEVIEDKILEHYTKTHEVISKVTQSTKPKAFTNTHWQQVYKKMEKLLGCCEKIKTSIVDSKDASLQKTKQLEHLRDFLALELYQLSQEISFGFRNGSRLYNFLLQSIATIKDIKMGLFYASFFEGKENSKPLLRNIEKAMSAFKLNPGDFQNFHEKDIKEYRRDTATIDKEANDLFVESVIAQTYIKI